MSQPYSNTFAIQFSENVNWKRIVSILSQNISVVLNKITLAGMRKEWVVAGPYNYGPPDQNLHNQPSFGYQF